MCGVTDVIDSSSGVTDSCSSSSSGGDSDPNDNNNDNDDDDYYTYTHTLQPQPLPLPLLATQKLLLLETEIKSGAPNERRIFQLAAEQAKREAGKYVV